MRISTAWILLLASFGLSGCGYPSQSEMTLAQYDKTCHFSDWERYCKDKYLQFSGTIEDIDTLKRQATVDVDEKHSFNVGDLSNVDSLQIGARVVFGGYLTKHGMLTDGLSGGWVEPSSAGSEGQAQSSGAAGPSDSDLIDLCTSAISQQSASYEVSSAFNGSYEGSSVVANSDGSKTVSITHSRKNVAGMCPTKLIGSCTFRGREITSKSPFRDNGYFAC